VPRRARRPASRSSHDRLPGSARCEVPRGLILRQSSGVNHLVQSRPLGFPHIHDIYASGPQTGKDKEASRARCVAVTAAAGIPAEMVQLIADVRYFQPMDDATVRSATAG